jgi:hypothetical protein
LRSVGETSARQRAGTATPPKHLPSSASEERRFEVSRARLTLLLVNAALLAAWLGQFRGPNKTFSDGD